MKLNETLTRQCRVWPACLALSATLLSTPSIAQTVQEPIREDALAVQALALKDEYQAVTPAAVAHAKSELLRELDALDVYLTKGGVAEGWKRYLDWQVLLDQLTEGVEPDREALRAVLGKFTANQPGLELSRFRSVAAALRRYIEGVEVLAIPDAAAFHAAQMESLAKALAAATGAPTAEQMNAISQGLHWLQLSGQAADFVSAVQRQYAHPNFLVDVSSRFVAAGLTQPLDYTDPIRDRILGASITGWGRTTGTMHGELVADTHHAAMRFNVTGRTDTNTVARKGHVTVWGDGVNTFTAHKTLTLDESGFSSGAASSCARSDNRVRNLSAPPLIRLLTRMQLAHQRSEGNRIAASHAVPLINERIDREAEPVIASANDAYTSEFRNPLLRCGAFPRQLNFRTTNQELSVLILQAAPGQIGAPQPAATFTLAHDIGIRLHETAVDNLAESLLAGRTLTDEEVRANVSKFLTMTSLEQFTPGQEEQPWSVTFTARNPITVGFRDGAYTLVIAGDRWTSDGRSFRNLNVTVTYRIESTDGQVQLVREEEILIAPPGFVRGQSRLSPTVISARRVLQRKFEELLPAVINPHELVVPGPWEKAGPLSVVSMAADAGWLEVSWQMQAPSMGNTGRGRLLAGRWEQ